MLDRTLKIGIFYVGSSLLAPLRKAEEDINRKYGIDLRVAAHNFGAPFSNDEWQVIERDIRQADVVFVIHVMDGENAARLIRLLAEDAPRVVVVINCMADLMRRTRMGKLDFARLAGLSSRKGAKPQRARPPGDEDSGEQSVTALLRSMGSWVARQARHGSSRNGANNHRAQYLKFADRLPSLLRLVPNAGALRDAKNYLMLLCYFLQPSRQNIRSMLLYALQQYVDDERLKQLKIDPPESLPVIGIYHPDAATIFETFVEYERWYAKRANGKSGHAHAPLHPSETIGLLLMRPQIVSDARKHYDGLIRAIEAEGLSVLPVISTLMDNREACEKFFVGTQASGLQPTKQAGRLRTARVSQIVSLTGFSFVGGPAMNDSEAAADFLTQLNIPYRSLVSLDAQTIDSWRESFTGLNPVQTGMQVAIPEIDGATEPFVFGGIPERGVEPMPLEDRCRRVARRLKRWRRLQTCRRDQLKLALVIYCFPPNKGNIGTAADLDVLASLLDILRRLKDEGYCVDVPNNVGELRSKLVDGNSASFGSTANVAYRMKAEEYSRQCPFVQEIEAEWGTAPGAINSFENDLLIQGITLGNIFIGVQPTFGFEDDPMRLLMSRGGAPHHGFAGFYTYIEKIFQADAIVHVGTHGALEFMPGKQVCLSSECWPDRLIDEMPNIYIYSVNNPSEGTIAKRRSYAELISYLTPPIENAGLYKGLAALKDSINSYRLTDDEQERDRLFQSIEVYSRELNLTCD